MLQFTLVCVLLQSCGNSSTVSPETTRRVESTPNIPNTQDAPKTPENPDSHNTQSVPRILEFECEKSGSCESLKKIRELLDSDRTCQNIPHEIERVDCFSDVPLHFSDQKFNMPGARKERILVTETKVDEVLPISYRSRFVDYLSFEEGLIVSKDPVIVIPANLKKIIEIRNEEISRSFYLYKGISIQTLTELALLSNKIYEAYKTNKGTGHNRSIVGSLIEYNPEHAFVALDNFTLQGIFGKKALCSHSPSLLFAQAEKIKTDFARIISDYNIGYINFSSGYTSRLIAEEFKSTCGQDIGYSTAHYLEMALELFFESMGSNDQTILVQSAAYEGNVGNIDKNEWRYPSRIRVGAINMMYSDLNQDGVSAKVSNFANLLSRYDGMGVHADVYVNLAIDLYFDISPSTFMSTGIFGLGIFQAINMHSTSIAAPLGLSRIIAIKDTSFPGEDLNPKIIDKIKVILTPKKCHYLTEQKCIFQDPSKHKELMIYKLGYR